MLLEDQEQIVSIQTFNSMNMTNITNIHQNKKRASKPSAGYKIPFSTFEKIFLFFNGSKQEIHFT
jgi:hypothetical protein